MQPSEPSAPFASSCACAFPYPGADLPLGLCPLIGARGCFSGHSNAGTHHLSRYPSSSRRPLEIIPRLIPLSWNRYNWINSILVVFPPKFSMIILGEPWQDWIPDEVMRNTGTHQSTFHHMQPLRVQIIPVKHPCTQEEPTAQSDLLEEEAGVAHALCVAVIEPLGAGRLFDVDPVEARSSLAPGMDRRFSVLCLTTTLRSATSPALNAPRSWRRPPWLLLCRNSSLVSIGLILPARHRELRHPHELCGG